MISIDIQAEYIGRNTVIGDKCDELLNHYRQRIYELENAYKEKKSKLAKRLIELKKRAYQKGLLNGQSSGLSAFEEQLKVINKQQQEILRKTIVNTLDTAFLIAECIIRKELSLDPQLIVKEIQILIEKFQIQDILTLNLDAKLVNNDHLKHMLTLYEIKNIEFIITKAVGDFELYTRRGIFKFSWTEQLRQLKEKILEIEEGD